MKQLIYIFLFLPMLGQAHIATTDSTKTREYPLSDPRNPNCPCHKQQKQADEEYQQILKAENILLSEKVLVNQRKDDCKGRMVFNRSAYTFPFNTALHKKWRCQTFNVRKHFHKTLKGVKKKKPNYSSCVQW